MPVAEVCRRMAVSEQSFYRWKNRYAGLGLSELREMRQLRDENRKLTSRVTDLTLDKHILQEALGKSGEACGQVGGGALGRTIVSPQRAPRLQADRRKIRRSSLQLSPTPI